MPLGFPWSKKPKPEPQWRGCAVYALGESTMIYVFAQARLAESHANLTHAFTGSVAPAAGAEMLGREILRALELYDPALPDDAGYAALKKAPVAAGFKSWNQLEQSTRHVAVASDGKVVRVTPYLISRSGGLMPLSDQLPPTCAP
jgi:hypothetical protein